MAYHAGRGQYHSTTILKQLLRRPHRESWRVLGVTEMDLYIPILTFVFGEAQLVRGRRWCRPIACGRSSTACRPTPRLLQERLLKEAIHELGHTYGPAPLPRLHLRDERLQRRRTHRPEKAEFCPACARSMATDEAEANVAWAILPAPQRARSPGATNAVRHY